MEGPVEVKTIGQQEERNWLQACDRTVSRQSPRRRWQRSFVALSPPCNPKKLSFSGPYAYGTPSGDSDIDLLVILDTPARQSATCVSHGCSDHGHFRWILSSERRLKSLELWKRAMPLSTSSSRRAACYMRDPIRVPMVVSAGYQ
jgi:hypothetical protein